MIETVIRIIWLLVLLFTPARPSVTPPDPCDFADAFSLNSYDHALETHLAVREVTRADHAALRRLDGIYDWVGYDAGGFDRPELEYDPIEIVVILNTGDMRYIYLYDDLDPATDIQWLWAFRSLASTTDANGDHLGLHDICASGGWALADIAVLLRP